MTQLAIEAQYPFPTEVYHTQPDLIQVQKCILIMARGTPLGPFSLSEINPLLASGKFQRDQLACTTRTNVWMPLSHLIEKFQTPNPAQHLEETKTLFFEALRLLREVKRITPSVVQRRLKLPLNRAAQILELLEHSKAVSPPDKIGRRENLLPHS